MTELARWAHEQQAVAVESVEHNRTAVHVRGCIRCGRTDTMVVYRAGRADEPVCADWKACDERTAALLR